MTWQSNTANCSNSSLLLQIKKDPKVKNVMHYNNLIGCLDLHLTEIDLINYRGSTFEIKLARFFVLEASVLIVMGLAFSGATMNGVLITASI